MKDKWDKFYIIGSVVGQLLIPLFIGIFGYYINESIANADINIKKFEIALDVLNNPTDTSKQFNQESRVWAEKFIGSYLKIEPTILMSTKYQGERVVFSDTLEEGNWFIDEVSGISMLVKDIKQEDNEVRAAGTIVRPGHNPPDKEWGPWLLPNQWFYERDNTLYSIVVNKYKPDAQKCIITVYKLI